MEKEPTYTDHGTDSENPWEQLADRKLPTTSPDWGCRFYLEEIQRRGFMGQVESFVKEKRFLSPKHYASVEEFEIDNPDYYSAIDNSLTYGQKSALREYSGYRFAWLNSVERGFWDYDKMGRKTPELEAEIKKTNDQIDEAITSAPTLKCDLLSFRGTNLDAFRKYGISNVGDLVKLNGEFFLEYGFTSTALLRERSFADREFDDFWIGKSNIEIRYHIPAKCHDAIALFTDDLSYSPNQTEILINRHSLNYVTNVKVDGDHALIDMLMIPREVYGD